MIYFITFAKKFIMNKIFRIGIVSLIIGIAFLIISGLNGCKDVEKTCNTNLNQEFNIGLFFNSDYNGRGFDCSIAPGQTLTGVEGAKDFLDMDQNKKAYFCTIRVTSAENQKCTYQFTMDNTSFVNGGRGVFYIKLYDVIDQSKKNLVEVELYQKCFKCPDLGMGNISPVFKGSKSFFKDDYEGSIDMIFYNTQKCNF